MDLISFESFVKQIDNGDYNCIIVNKNDAIRFKSHGIKTLLAVLEENPCVLESAYVFDSIVGKAAAALMILGKVKEIYADVISENAVALFDEWKVKYSYKTKVSFIENRTHSGLCPMEEISIKCSTLDEIKTALSAFTASKNSMQ